jgi:hypothetical protein
MNRRSTPKTPRDAERPGGDPPHSHTSLSRLAKALPLHLPTLNCDDRFAANSLTVFSTEVRHA